MRNAILGAISLAVLVPVGPAAKAPSMPVTTAALTPTAIPLMRHDSVKVVARVILAVPMEYTVKPGDSLSAIAGKEFGNPDKWPWLYDANKNVVGNNPNLIEPGEKLIPVLGSKPEYGAAVAAVNNARQVTAAYRAATSNSQGNLSYGHPNYCGDGDGDGWDVNCQTKNAPSPVPQSFVRVSSLSSTPNGSWPGGAFGNCVVTRESGGNSQVMNSSGHYGLYQFSASTWAAYGGNPATFGNASVAEQEAVFMNALSRGGQSNWSPYDGC